MATDREGLGDVILITRIIYSLDSGDLMQRTRISVKDTDGVKHLISNEIVNLGKKAPYKRHLKSRKDRLELRIGGVADEVSFLDEQITDIEAL